MSVTLTPLARSCTGDRAWASYPPDGHDLGARDRSARGAGLHRSRGSVPLTCAMKRSNARAAPSNDGHELERNARNHATPSTQRPTRTLSSANKEVDVETLRDGASLNRVVA